MLTIELRIVIKLEYVGQYLLTTYSIGICSWSYTQPHLTQKEVSN